MRLPSCTLAGAEFENKGPENRYNSTLPISSQNIKTLLLFSQTLNRSSVKKFIFLSSVLKGIKGKYQEEAKNVDNFMVI